jgi:steroid 5-alpha reductase family enzyme
MRQGSSSIVGIVWVVIGVIVAASHAFFVHLNAVTPILSAILAVLLWPLVLLGVNLHLS